MNPMNTRKPFRPWPFAEDHLTEPEGKSLDALRLWTQAQNDLALTARLDAWDELHFAASLALDGQTTALADFVGRDAALAHLSLQVARFIEKKENEYLTGNNGRYHEDKPTEGEPG